MNDIFMNNYCMKPFIAESLQYSSNFYFLEPTLLFHQSVCYDVNQCTQKIEKEKIERKWRWLTLVLGMKMLNRLKDTGWKIEHEMELI